MIALSPTELTTIQQLLHSYAPAQTTLNILTQNNGDLADCLAQLTHPQTFTAPNTPKSLWDSTLTVLRQELCSDEGWRGKVKEYTKNPASVPLLTGMIVHLVSSSHLKLDPGIALYISKVGLEIFCEHIKPTVGIASPAENRPQ
jgi:hypothetical protein